MATPPGEVHPVCTTRSGHRDGMLALPFTVMSSPHQQRCRACEAGTSASECAQEQWDPLGGGEAPDEDQHHGVTVRAQQALQVVVAISDCAFDGGLVPTLRILDEPTPEQGSALSAGDRSGTELLVSTPFGTADTRSASTPNTSTAVARSSGDTTTR